jgi:iron(III) transport system substrate-binding protein
MTRKAVTRIETVLIILVILFAAVAAYGWFRPLSSNVTNVVTGTLEEAAQEEGGNLVIYHALDAPDFPNTIIPEFLKTYPWAHINALALETPEVSTRAIAEYKAGNVQADVLITTGGPIGSAVLAGAVQNVTVIMESLMDYPAGSSTDYMHVSYILPQIIVYNTAIVTDPSVLPKTYQDLADPRWKNNIVFDKPSLMSIAGGLFETLKPIMGDANWTSLMNALAAQNPRYTSAGHESYTVVASGEAAIGIGLVHDVVAGKAAGAPVNAIFLEPTTELWIPSAMTKNAPHPNMALLFLNWWASWEGQKAVALTGRFPQHPGALAYLKPGIAPANVTLIPAGAGIPDFYTNTTKYSDEMLAIFGA